MDSTWLNDTGTAPRTHAAALEAPAAARVRPVIVGMFYLMIASLLIELPQRTFRWEVPTITASLFLLTTFLQPGVCFRRTHPALHWLMAYVFVFAALAVWHGWPDTMAVAQLFLFLLQAYLVAWATFNLMQRDEIGRKALWWFVAACVVHAALPLMGVERTALTEHATGAERIAAFGQDPNYSAVLMSAGLLIALGLTHGPVPTTLRRRVVAWGIAFMLAASVVATGSRGGLLALAAGVVAFALRPGRGSRLRGAFIALIVLGVLAQEVRTSYVMRKRIESTAQGGAMAGRELLFPAFWQMFLERPVDGWGPINNQYQVVVRATDLILREDQVAKDPHNLLLELLTATGLLGTVPFLAALALCLRAAWRARWGEYGTLPLALLALFLVANLGLNQVVHKPFWVFLAFAMVSERVTQRANGGRSGPPES
ncbi:MAG TPA: O-antigen ligase family protein [Gemmatimonadales bacterium]